jgi:branched-chain amino acid transport system substrate-binding protein
MVGLAGCSGDGSDGDGGDDNDSDTDGDTGGQTPTSGGSNDLPDTIKMGFMAPLSGPYSYTGNQHRNGLDLALDKINTSDNLLPNTTIEYVEGDTETDPQTAQSVAREFIQEENVDLVFGGVASSAASAVSQFCASQNVPYFINQSSALSLTTSDCKFTTIRATANTEHFGSAGEWMVNEFGSDGYILYEDYSFGQAVRDSVKKYAKQAGGNIVTTTPVQIGNSDYSSAISDIKSSDADWVYMGNPASFTAYLTQATSQGMEKPMGGVGMSAQIPGQLSEDQLSNLKGGLYRAPAAYLREIDSDLNDEYTSDYLERFGAPTNVNNA